MKIKEPKYEIFVCRDFYIDNVLRNSFNTLSSININNSFLAKQKKSFWIYTKNNLSQINF